MGDPAFDEKKQGKASGSAAADAAIASPGKGSGVDKQLAPGERPAKPPEFAAMDDDIVDKLWASRTRFSTTNGKADEQFWDGIRMLSVANLHTLMVVCRGAKAIGFWGNIETILSIYTYGSSFGIHFLGPAAAGINGDFGKDAIQAAVRGEHGNTLHDWYRHKGGGPGAPALHLGVDVGAGDHNIHWDPTNPMDHVSKGEITNIPFTLNPTYVPKGIAIYNERALAHHAAEIGYFGKKAEEATKGPESITQKFLKISPWDAAVKKVKDFARREEEVMSLVFDRKRAAERIVKMRSEAAKLEPLMAQAHDLALKPDSTAEGTELDEIHKKIDAIPKEPLWEAQAGLMQHLISETKDNIPSHNPDLEGFQFSNCYNEHAIHGEDLERKFSGLQLERQIARRSTKAD